MEHTTFTTVWRVTPPEDEAIVNLLRAQNETNRLLAAIGTLLEERLPTSVVNEYIKNGALV